MLTPKGFLCLTSCCRVFWGDLKGCKKHVAMSKKDAENMVDDEKLENIIMKLYYQEVVTFQLTETKSCGGVTQTRVDSLMRSKVG